jgi:hypothetical protein
MMVSNERRALVEASSENAKRVYAALAAFGAPLSAFDVGVEDFASYDGVLQLFLFARPSDPASASSNAVAPSAPPSVAATWSRVSTKGRR